MRSTVGLDPVDSDRSQIGFRTIFCDLRRGVQDRFCSNNEATYAFRRQREPVSVSDEGVLVTPTPIIRTLWTI